MNTDMLSSASFEEILSTTMKLQDDVDTLKRKLAEEILAEAKEISIDLLAEAKSQIKIVRDPAAANKVICKLKEIAKAALALEQVLADEADSLEEQENLKKLLR
jgi:hypothetical protein